MPQGCFYFLLAAIEDRSRRGLNSACDIRDDKLATLNVPDVSDPRTAADFCARTASPPPIHLVQRPTYPVCSITRSPRFVVWTTAASRTWQRLPKLACTHGPTLALLLCVSSQRSIPAVTSLRAACTPANMQSMYLNDCRNPWTGARAHRIRLPWPSGCHATPLPGCWQAVGKR